MASRFTVVQYVPDLIAGERINVGVIAWDDQSVRCRFVKNWSLVSRFGGEEAAYVRQFAEQVEHLADGQTELAFSEGVVFDQGALERIVSTWGHSIQFAEPRASTKAADEVLVDVAPLFLKRGDRTVHRSRSKRAAAGIAARALTTAVEMRFDKKPNLVHKNRPIQGAVDSHSFDVVLANGIDYAAVNAISFEIQDEVRLKVDVDAAAWAFDDVRKQSADLPLAVCVLPPIDGNNRLYKNAKRIFGELDVSVLSEQQMSQWAVERVRQVEIHANHRP